MQWLGNLSFPNEDPECGSYACLNDACRTSCTSNVHCAAGLRCYSAFNTCTSKKLNGEGCSGNSQCASGQCVDGVCCESGCGSTCEACVQSKTGASNGLCRAIRSGNDYDNECADRSCSGDLRVAYSASTCSNRSCSSQTATSCGVYKCNNSTKACRTSCSSDSHCQPEAPTCVGGICTSNQAPSAWNQSFSVDEMGSTNVNLAASDPDGDPLTFHKRSQNGVSVSWRNQSSGAITISANTCGDSASFQYRVSDSKGLYSPWRSVSVASTTVVHRSQRMGIRMVATARRLAAMPISAIVAQRPTAAVLRSGNTAAREPSQRLDVVGRGSLTLGNPIARQ